MTKTLYTRDGSFLYYIGTSDNMMLSYTMQYAIVEYSGSTKSYYSTIEMYSTEGKYNIFLSEHELDIINI